MDAKWHGHEALLRTKNTFPLGKSLPDLDVWVRDFCENVR